MRKHRLAERLLADVIGLDWAYVHDEACRWEHVMSEQVERRLLVLLDHPTESPYGNPIPALDELGDAAGRAVPAGRRQHRRPGRRRTGPVTGTIRRLGEPVQFEPELLTSCSGPASCRARSRPSRRAGSYVLLQVEGHGDGLELPGEVAVHVYVERG